MYGDGMRTAMAFATFALFLMLADLPLGFVSCC
jgi:hypothetical protein